MKQVNIVIKQSEKKKIEYKLNQTSRIIMHAHDDVFLLFLIITSL
jgi:hypothetical protein